jgi:hypothetical protein
MTAKIIIKKIKILFACKSIKKNMKYLFLIAHLKKLTSFSQKDET